MVVKEVLLLGDPTLREASEPVTDFDEFHEILEDLKDTLTWAQEYYGMGRAAAAPQLGYLKRVVYVQMPDRSFYLVNPEIVRPRSSSRYPGTGSSRCSTGTRTVEGTSRSSETT